MVLNFAGTEPTLKEDLAIQIDLLTKHYGSGPLAVDSLTMQVKRGEIFGFLGPNGAGKTTTMRLLMDLIRPTSGSARIFGMDCYRDSLEVRRRVGYLPGELSLYRGYTGRRLLNLAADLRPGQVAHGYVSDLCQRLQVELETPIGRLSHGNRQKVGLLVALMSRPDLLVLDEPTSGLDPLMQHQVLDLLEDVRASGKTVFFSSHNLPEVERICDRVGIIRAGQLVAIESVDTLTSRRMQRIQIAFGESVPSGVFAGMQGVRLLGNSGGKAVHLEIIGNMDLVVKTAAKYRIVSIETEQLSLESVFLAYYQDQNFQGMSSNATPPAP